MNQQNFVNVNEWCIKNGDYNYINILKILRSHKVNLIKIGSDYFVESEAQILNALGSYALKSKERTERKRASAIDNAQKRRELEKALVAMMARGETTLSDVEVNKLNIYTY